MKKLVKRIGQFAMILSVLTGLVLAAQPLEQVSAADTPKTCQQVQVPVALAPGQAATYHISGSLCYRGDLAGKTVQVLAHGATMTHVYWDLPYQPEKYSYVDALTDAGYATFNYDQIGVGNSSRPLLKVTVDTNIYVIHQIVQKLRSGKIGDVSFSKVIGVGHSFGSIKMVAEAGKYPNDFDGLVVTGFLMPPDLVNLAHAFATVVPAQLDPVLQDQNYPLGYFTLSKANRKWFFYNSADTDPNIYEIDNQTKGIITTGEIATLALDLLPTYSRNITVPILLADGQNDAVFCEELISPCRSEAALQLSEALYYPKASSIDTFILPNSGHNMNYQLNAQDLYTKIIDWSDAHVGTN